jgi:arginyl-tRNA synthetase
LGAVTDNQADLDIVLCQLVSLEKDGKPFKMSKRAGNFVMIEDVLEEIDADVLRLFMVMKSADTQMTFDLQKAKEQSKDNPVYYIQYAYARACSVLKKYGTVFAQDLSALLDIDFKMESASAIEKRLVKFMADYPSVIEGAGRTKNPQILTKYLEDLAGAFHSLWSTQDGVKLIDEGDLASTQQHMLLVMALKNVIGNGLQTIGAKLKESM